MARPKIEITEAAIEIIEKYAGQGCTLHQIALMLDISDSTLDRWQDHPRVKRAWQRGRAIAAGEVTGKLYALALGGDVVATIFYLKAQLGWSDKVKDEPLTTASVQIYLPDNSRDSIPANFQR